MIIALQNDLTVIRYIQHQGTEIIGAEYFVSRINRLVNSDSASVPAVTQVYFNKVIFTVTYKLRHVICIKTQITVVIVKTGRQISVTHSPTVDERTVQTKSGYGKAQRHGLR